MPTGREELDLKVYLDFAQQRQNRSGPYVFATDGTQVDAGTKVNCIIDPSTLSVFGTPLPMTNEWKSGIGASDVNSHYYRFQKSDFTFTSAGGSNDWLDIPYKTDGDTYIISGSGVTARQQAPIQLTSGVERNEALFFSYSKLEKKNTDNTPLLKLFWVDQNNINNNTQLHFKADGSCDVYRGYTVLSGQILTSSASNALVGNNTRFLSELSNGQEIYDEYGRLLGFISLITDDTNAVLTANSLFTYLGPYTNKQTANKVQSYSRTESNYSQGRPISTIANPNDQFNDVYIIPMRGKELLVMTSYGLNFSHSFSDLNTPDPPVNINYYWSGTGSTTPSYTNISSTPIILPKGSFSIVISQGKIAFQLAKLFFKTNWSIESGNINFPTAPPILPTTLTGNITASQGSTVISGTSTLFTSQLAAGDRLSIIDTNNINSLLLGFVDTINNDTSLYLTDPSNYSISGNFYKETSLSGLISYSIGSTSVTGSGSLFTTELNDTDLLYDNNNNLIGQVNSISNNTQLYLDSPSSLTAVNSANTWKNINIYSNRFSNLQAEIFGQTPPQSLLIDQNNISLDVDVITGSGSTTNMFNNSNKDFKLKISSKSVSAIANTSSADYGYAFYSSDLLFTLFNEKTFDSNVDITSAIESLSINRNENGDLSLSLSARHKMLTDLGVSKPNILSNRPIKVQLEPRIKQLSGTITANSTGVITGSGTSFTTDFTIGDKLYKTDGSLVGIVTSVTSNTNLLLLENAPFTGSGVSYSDEPNYDPILLFDGYLDSPDINYIQGENYSEYALLDFNAIDKKQRLNFSYFNVAPNFDNFVLPEVVKNTLYLSGLVNNNPDVNSFVYNPSFYYNVPINRNNSQGQYNFVLNLGDTSGGFIEKIRTDFAQNNTFLAINSWEPDVFSRSGWNNDARFYMKDLNYISSDNPAMVLYLNEETAVTNGLIPIYETSSRTVRNLQKTYETPEANRIIITGLDKTDGSRIDYIRNDEISQDPLLPPASRPDNWLGDVYPFVMINDKLNTYSDVQLSGNQFYEKLTEGREIISFDSDLLTYFNSEKSFINNNIPLTGTITLNATTSVVGTGTSFTTELSIGDELYNSSATFIGYVKNINNNTSLDLLEPTILSGSNLSYNKSTYYLNQYSYLEIGDTFYIADLNNNLETYMVIDWSVDFEREYLNPSYNQIIPRFAKYRAKKVTVPSSNSPIIISPNSNQPLIANWIVNSGYNFNFIITAIAEQYKTLTLSLSNEPVGMTISQSGNNAIIEWVPSISDENDVYNNITVTASDGTNSATFIFNIRVYPN